MEARLKKPMRSAPQREAHMYAQRLAAERSDRRFELGLLALEVGPVEAARISDTTYSRAQYALKKVQDPDFHPGSWGGQRSERLKYGSMENDDLAQVAIYTAVAANPFHGSKELLHEVREIEGFEDMSLTFLKDTIRSWGWTWRKTKKKMINKFTPANMEKYLNFIELFRTLDLSKVKFMDESGFKPKDLTCSKRVGPVGVDLPAVNAFPNEQKLCLTVLACIDNPEYPVFHTISEGKSDRWSFYSFLMSAVEHGYIRAGDWVVFDNAPAHAANDMLAELEQEFAAIGAHLVFLPAYSPELNPCEMIFSFLKQYLRNHFKIAPLLSRLVEALREITFSSIVNYFRKTLDSCIETFASVEQQLLQAFGHAE